MKYRRRIYSSAEQRAEIWDRWQRGESMSSIGRAFDRQSSSVFSVISPTGGIRPLDRKRGHFALSLSEREEISRGLSTKQSLRKIARQLGRAPSTISREVRRNGGSVGYRASRSDQAAWDRALRPKLCKLACHPMLAHAVSAKLRRKWSSEQIAGWLKRAFPGGGRTNRCHTRRSIEAFIYRHVAFPKRSCWRTCAQNAQSGVPSTLALNAMVMARLKMLSPSATDLHPSRIVPFRATGKAT